MDFVTYEIGKKLKDKEYPHGYNRFGYRPIYSDECTIRYLWDTGAYEEEYYGENIPCPTINEVIEWLIEDKGLYVDVSLCKKGWFSIVYETNFPDDKDYAESWRVDGLSGTYKEAAIVGIDYVLDNLI